MLIQQLKWKIGSIVVGESEIPEYAEKQSTYIEKLYVEPENPKPMDGAIDEILSADIIVIGPGSLYTSIIPNFLVDGITKAVNKSKAKKIYICNVMTQNGETRGFTVKKHIETLLKHSGNMKIDYVIVNDKRIEDDTIVKRYADMDQYQILITGEDLAYGVEHNMKMITGDILDTNKYVKHDTDKVSKIIKEIYLKEAKTKEFKK